LLTSPARSPRSLPPSLPSLSSPAGVGKGREVAALCWENWLCGRKRALWLTANADLLLDANRDLRDIGAGHIPTRLLSKIPHGQPIAQTLPEGVLVVPYSQLTAAARRAQLFAWLGADGAFSGLLALDEAHKAKAAKAGAVGQAVIELQQRYLDARVVYLSATGATQFEDMGCAQATRRSKQLARASRGAAGLGCAERLPRLRPRPRLPARSRRWARARVAPPALPASRGVRGARLTHLFLRSRHCPRLCPPRRCPSARPCPRPRPPPPALSAT
jgi:hypothetical protein